MWVEVKFHLEVRVFCVCSHYSEQLSDQSRKQIFKDTFRRKINLRRMTSVCSVDRELAVTGRECVRLLMILRTGSEKDLNAETHHEVGFVNFREVKLDCVG